MAASLSQQLHRNRVPAERRLVFGTYCLAVVIAAVVATYDDFGSLPQTVANAPSGLFVTAALALLADAMPVSLPGKWNTAAIFLSVTFTFAIMLTYGVATAVVVQALAVAISSWRLKHALWRAVFNFAQYALAFGVAHLIYVSIRDDGAPRPNAVLGIVAAAVTWFAVKYLTTAVAIQLRDDVSWWPMVLGPLGAEAMTTGSLLLMAPALMMQQASQPEFIPLILLPLLAVRRLAIMTAQQRHLASIDPLTGLANRKALIAEVSSCAVSHSRRAVQGDPASRFALILLDLDRFKNVNDALGHEVGDRLLVAVGDRLAQAARPGDLVARLGGDEFALLLTNTDANRGAARARDIADAAAGHCVRWNNADLPVRFSLGVQPYGSGDREEEVIRLADSRMYRDKANRRPQAANRRATA